jgi:hypothetical protein
MNRSKRIHPALPLHSPEGAMHSQASEPARRVALKATVGPEGLPSEPVLPWSITAGRVGSAVERLHPGPLGDNHRIASVTRGR